MKVALTTLPIVQRELLVSSRRRLTFWSRMSAGLLGFITVFFIVGVEPDMMIAGALGARLFQWLSTGALGICLIGGALLTADCLSVEKREGTLGLLFLTDLKGYDVVLGKLAAKSITALFCLLAIFPMLAVPILLGGVTGGDFWRVVLVLLNTLFLSASLGMVVSVFQREARNSIALAEFLVLFVVLAPVAGTASLPAGTQLLLSLVSPLFSFRAATPGPFSAWFPWSVLVQHLLAWTCLFIAGRRAQTCWHESSAEQRWRLQWREILRGGAAARLAVRRLLLPVNPILWLESRDRCMRAILFVLVLVLAVFAWFLNRGRTFHWSHLPSAIWTVAFLHLFLLGLLAFEVSARMVEARRDGALTVVLSTRLSVEDILRGEFLAARRMFGGPLLIVLAFDMGWMVEVLRHTRWPNQIEVVVIALCLEAALVANCCGLIWTALHNSMRAKRPHRAALRSFGEVVLFPLVWFGFILVGAKEHGNLSVGVVAFTILNFVNTWVFGNGGYQRFKTDLRETLTEHPRPPEKNYGEDYALLGG